MKKLISRKDFDNLDFELKCLIVETLLPEEYYQGQTDINFYTPPEFEGEIGEPLPPTPKKIKMEEDRKFKALINSLKNKVFANSEVIEFDFEGE